jgi:hypothetical protein
MVVSYKMIKKYFCATISILFFVYQKKNITLFSQKFVEVMMIMLLYSVLESSLQATLPGSRSAVTFAEGMRDRGKGKNRKRCNYNTLD